MGCGASKSPPELKAGKSPVVAAAAAKDASAVSLVALLEELKLSSYLPRFEEQGWDDVDHIRRLDRDGLVNLCRDVGLDLKPGHQARFIERFRPEHVQDNNMVVSIGDIESVAADHEAGGVRVAGMTVGGVKWTPQPSASEDGEDGEDLVVVALDEPPRESSRSGAKSATPKRVGSPPRSDEPPELNSHQLDDSEPVAGGGEAARGDKGADEDKKKAKREKKEKKKKDKDKGKDKDERREEGETATAAEETDEDVEDATTGDEGRKGKKDRKQGKKKEKKKKKEGRCDDEAETDEEAGATASADQEEEAAGDGKKPKKKKDKKKKKKKDADD